MPANLHSIQPLRRLCRFASLLAYAGAFSIYHHAQPIAAQAYDDLCAGQGISFGQPTPLSELCVALLVAAVPVALVRSTVSVVLALALALLALLAAMSLLATAGHPPYECFTQAGTYEDHVSGLGDFELASALLVLLSYLLLAVDLLIWIRRRLIARGTGAAARSGLSPSPPQV
ncbi:hypothetical protein [Bradyrhizobium sp. SRS-191]|uniref:hypothetical protein n=1 Tax=Bradyrhizobium sp. SRS-191 TaxID=2962606 RepID=UPI00211EDE00|nr:hypothetical protein [Bradyrhizobium sp. SRS-191]